MSFPRRRALQFDESAGSNQVQCPFGHLWVIRSIYMKYVADSNAATRVVILQANHQIGPQASVLFNTTIIASTSEIWHLGNTDQQANWNAAQDLKILSLVALDTLELEVTLEQAGDVWDVWTVIDDYVVPRA